jgi:hypothetical protein
MDAFQLLLFFLAVSTSQALICGDRNQCHCSGLIMESEEVPKLPQTERMDTELESRNVKMLT